MTSPITLFDAHLHIIDPHFPLIANQGYLPEPFTCTDYLQRMQACTLRGGAVVSGSFQGFDQTYLCAALAQLGPGFVGVTQVPEDITDDELQALHQAGVRAVRFNLKRGGSAPLDALDSLARRVHDLLGWHVELYVDSRELPALTERLLALPAVSIDHLGLSRDGLPALLKLVERGVHVKATGFGRLDMDPVNALRTLHAANPHALMFGTDLPSTRAPRAYQDADLQLILDQFDAADAQRILCDNALAFYRIT